VTSYTDILIWAPRGHFHLRSGTSSGLLDEVRQWCCLMRGHVNTFDCLTNYSDITALLNSIHGTSDLFPFQPTFDGSHSPYPDLASRLLSRGHFSRLPFIAGTNLDEGKYFAIGVVPWVDTDSGTTFVTPTVSSEGLV
jgi:hypothetical protein